ncbi:hypothetical protein F8B43_5492 [Methylorubrum populi]|uniref:Uncharacterized protein n=1 Tax=Methylorubrum populi TaxID=223967 RepID=A0A833J1J7_9HYPH|nr:hypothetical protein F8B43_5492 [Methylorubrum populi]
MIPEGNRRSLAIRLQQGLSIPIPPPPTGRSAGRGASKEIYPVNDQFAVGGWILGHAHRDLR